MILVAVRDAPRRETIRAALAHEGWLVSVVGSLDSAFRMAADHAPRLVVLDSGLPGSDDLVDVFARSNGGPGILLVGDPSEGLRRQADAVVDLDVGQQDLVGAVKRCLEAPRPEGRKQRLDGSRRWTSEELFGEILEDLDAAVAAVESRGGEPPRPRRVSPLETATVAADEVRPPASAGAAAEEDVAVEREEPAAAVAEPMEPVVPDLATRPLTLEEIARARPAGAPEPVEEAEPAPPEGAAQEPPAVEEPVEAAEAADAPEEAVELAPEEVPDALEEAVELAPGEAPGASEEAVELAPGEAPDALEEAVELAPEEAPDALEEAVELAPEEAPDTLEEGVEPALEEAADDAEEAAEAAPVFELFEREEERRGAPRSAAGLDALADALLGAAGPAAEPEPEVAAPAAGETFDPFAGLFPIAGEDAAEPDDDAQAAAFEEVADEELAAAAPEPEPERRIGPYRLLERLDEGAAHELWRAEREETQERVVVRVVREAAAADERAVERFLAAGLAAGALDHPTIVPLLEAGWVDGQLIGVGEHVEGVSLDEVLAGMRELGVRMPLGLALAVGERVAAALAAAHAPDPSAGRPQGTVHGALHPGNVLLSAEGEVRVSDFALVRALGGDDAEAPVRRLRYRAPEQIAGDEPDRRSDLFSFGTLLYELVTGRPAFPGRDPAVVAGAILNEAPEEPEKVDPTVPAEVGGLISRLLKRRRDERLQGAGEAQRKLDLALQGLPSPPGKRELAAYLRQLRDAVALVRSVGDGDALAEAAPVAAEPSPFRGPEPAAPEDGEKLVPAVVEVPRWRRLWPVLALLVLLALGAALAYWWGRRAEAPAQTGTPVLVPPPAPRPVAPADRPPAGDEAASELVAPPPPPVSDAATGQVAAPDVEALVAEEFDRRQREMEELLDQGDGEEEPPAPENDPDEPPAADGRVPR